MTRLVLATHNRHKVVELRRILGDAGLGDIEVLSADDLPGLPDVAETGTTFAENALLKAHAVAAATGLPAVADDSGIAAAALNGAPGVRSARYAGEDATDEDNRVKLEAEVPTGTRLRYTCVIAHVDPDGEETLFEGICEGTMAPARSGTGGFGYDPLFVPDGGDGRTMADLGDDEKDAVSHRGIAARQLLAWLSA